MSSLSIKHITVRSGFLDIEVAVALDALHVDAQTAQHICELLPNLPKHVCVNGKGETFGEEIVGTELPHLLEHVIIELQGQADPKTRRSLTGHTSWLEELSVTGPQGYALMRVTVGFTDDFEALRALKQACELIEQ